MTKNLKRNPSEDVIEATITTICRFWAKQLKGAFHPDASASNCRLSPGLAARYDTDMDYIWMNTADPYDAAVQANLSANPQLYGSFDYRP